MQLMSVPFHKDNLVLINQGNEPFVAMKPIVVQMGLDWAAQFTKINEKFKSTIAIIATVGEDGRMREMICLPLRKLPAWLYSISPNKVAPEIRDKVIQYQEECDDVLWEYWTKGFAGKQPQRTSVALLKYRLQLIDKLEKERNSVKREAIYEQLKLVSEELGLTTPELDSLGYKNIHEGLMAQFWEFFNDNDDEINHAKDHSIIAINAGEVCELFSRYCMKKISPIELRQAFMNDENFIDNTTVRSKLEEKSVRCYRFHRR